jgi:hypothetical protein
MVLARRRVEPFGLLAWDDGPLPKLDNIYCGIYVREGGSRAALEQLADSIADILRPGADKAKSISDDYYPSVNWIRATNSGA